MNMWFEYDKLVAECVFRYGHFSLYTLSISEYQKYINYYCASQWITRNHGEGNDRPIRRAYSELMSKEMVVIIHMRSISREVWEIMEKYSLNELKQLVLRNYYPADTLYKSFKKNWAKAYLQTFQWSFNVFAIRSHLNDDVLRKIKTFL
jgi:hypothetical protein